MAIETVQQMALTVKQAAVFLNVSCDLLYDSVRKNQIPHQKLGTRILFSKTALLKWLEEKGNNQP